MYTGSYGFGGHEFYGKGDMYLFVTTSNESERLGMGNLYIIKTLSNVLKLPITIEKYKENKNWNNIHMGRGDCSL